MSVIDTAIYEQCWVQADQPFRTSGGSMVLRFENRGYVLKVGEPMMVPRGLVNLWLGNPDARDHPTDDARRHRTAERNRVARKWGNEIGSTPVFPQIHAWDFNQNLLPTIVEDPYGTSVAAPDPTIVGQAEIAAQQRQLAQAFQALRQYAAQNDIPLEELTGQDLTPQAPSMSPTAPTPPTPPLLEAPSFTPAQAPSPTPTPSDGPAWADPTAPAPSVADMPATPDPTATVKKKAPGKPRPGTVKANA